MKVFPNTHVNIPTSDELGIDLRDYFAAKALQGLLASNVCASKVDFAENAYALADAMMEARRNDGE